MILTIYNSLLLCLLTCATACAMPKDSVRTKTIMGAGCLTVPSNETWQIKRVLVSYGTYNMLTQCMALKQTYTANEQICSPVYCADADLVKNNKKEEDSVMYYIELVILPAIK